MNYVESIIAIPRCGLRLPHDYCGPFNFATRIDANELSPVLLGLIVGYPKHVSRMDSSSTMFTVTPVGAIAPILTAQFEPYGKKIRARDLLGAENAFAMLRDPVFSRSLVSPQIFTYVDWQLDEAWARAQHVNASVIVNRTCRGCPRKLIGSAGMTRQVLGRCVSRSRGSYPALFIGRLSRHRYWLDRLDRRRDYLTTGSDDFRNARHDLRVGTIQPLEDRDYPFLNPGPALIEVAKVGRAFVVNQKRQVEDQHRKRKHCHLAGMDVEGIHPVFQHRGRREKSIKQNRCAIEPGLNDVALLALKQSQIALPD